MCYGDVDHGKDGYYKEWIEQQVEQGKDQEQEG